MHVSTWWAVGILAAVLTITASLNRLAGRNDGPAPLYPGNDRRGDL